MPQRRIFVSYRREDTRHFAGRLHDHLKSRFGRENVFMDVGSIEPGVDYTEAIESALRASDVLLALIGRTWLSTTDDRGRRRLEDPDDLVAFEIKTALENGLRVIPLLIDGAAAPRRKDLPVTLHALARRNAVRLDFDDFDSDIDRLLDALQRVATPETGAPPPVQANPSTILDDGLPPVSDAVVVEYTDRQVVTFSWPDGADEVWAWVGPHGFPAEAMMVGEPDKITLEQYMANGSLQLRLLPWRGCAVHVVAASFRPGQTATGPPWSVKYDGLTRLHYTVGRAQSPIPAHTRLTVQISAEAEHLSAPPFTLVHNPDRLPLHREDGVGFRMRPVGDPRAVAGVRFRPTRLRKEPGDAAWLADGSWLGGYVRLFVCLEPERQMRVALLDPPIASLRIFPTDRSDR